MDGSASRRILWRVIFLISQVPQIRAREVG